MKINPDYLCFLYKMKEIILTSSYRKMAKWFNNQKMASSFETVENNIEHSSCFSRVQNCLYILIIYNRRMQATKEQLHQVQLIQNRFGFNACKWTNALHKMRKHSLIKFALLSMFLLPQLDKHFLCLLRLFQQSILLKQSWIASQTSIWKTLLEGQLFTMQQLLEVLMYFNYWLN